MATIGTIASNVTMRTAGFEQGAKRVASSAKQMGGSVKSSMGGLGGMGGTIGQVMGQFGGLGSSMGGIIGAAGPVAAGIAAVGAAAGAAYMTIAKVAEAMKRIDETAATASNLGIPIEKFIAYQHAANKAEVGSAEFEVAIKKLENAAADAAEGTGNAAKHFDKLGISAEKFKALSPDQQLAVIADKLQGVTNQAERAQIATDLFGKSGMGMLGFLKDGAAGLAEAEARAKMLGITLTDLDAAKVDAANDALDDLGGVFDGIWNQLAVALAPAIQSAAEGITGFFTDNMPQIKEFVGWIGRLASAVVEVGKVAWEIVSGPFKALWSGMEALGLVGGKSELGGMKQTAAAMPDVSKDGKEPVSKKMQAELDKLFEDTRSPAEKFALAQKDLTEKLDKGLITQDLFNRGVEKARQDMLKDDGTNDAKKKLKEQADKLFEATRTPAEEFAKKQADLNRLLSVGAIDKITAARGVKAAKLEQVKEEARLYKPAERPAALQRSSSEAMNQFIRNQQDQEGDPIAKLMKEQHEREIEKLEAIRAAVREMGTAKAMF